MYYLFNEDCLTAIKSGKIKADKLCIVTDPPFNVGYKYKTYKDKMNEDEYYKWLIEILTSITDKYVVIHYPEALYRIAVETKKVPEKVCAWVYNSNNPKQHRDVAYWGGVKPNFNQMKQPYKNPTDKRVMKLIESGKTGARLYDWWNINQVKNVSKEKTDHPCQMPLEVMKNIVGIIPKEYTIFDPFMGSGTTAVACKELGYDFIGCEIDEYYYEIAKNRLLENEV